MKSEQGRMIELWDILEIGLKILPPNKWRYLKKSLQCRRGLWRPHAVGMIRIMYVIQAPSGTLLAWGHSGIPIPHLKLNLRENAIKGNVQLTKKSKPITRLCCSSWSPIAPYSHVPIVFKFVLSIPCSFKVPFNVSNT